MDKGRTQLESLLVVLALSAACADESTLGLEQVPGPGSGPGASLSDGVEGGMDGAGSIGVGLRWDLGVVVQELWQDGALSFLVLNDRAEAVDFEACPHECGKGAALVSGSVPARSLRTFDGEAIARSVASGRSWLTAFRLDGSTRLGSVDGPWRPVPGARTVISASGNYEASYRAMLHRDGGLLPQLETDFVTAPGRAFTLTLSLPPHMPTISLLFHSEAASGIPTLNVIDARSSNGTIRSIAEGFVIAGTPQRDDAARTLVDVDVAVPDDFSGSFVAFQAFFCTGSTDVSDALGIAICGGAQIMRLFPVDPSRL